MTIDSHTEILSITFEQEPLVFIAREEQSGVYEQEEMDYRHNLTKEWFLDSIKGFTLDDVSPSQWRDKILEFYS